MIRQTPRARSGITLTEILISILIMGVGIISLATLFPLGLLRMREAARLSRSGYLTESAYADLNVRNLLNKQSFQNPFFSPWYSPTPPALYGTFSDQIYDPWVQDILSYSIGGSPPAIVDNGTDRGVSRDTGEGLPVAYDPLWRYQAAPNGVYLDGGSPEARFASGIVAGTIRNDPNTTGTYTLPSAYGLQRLTNFNPLTVNTAQIPDTFVSPEDVIWQSDGDQGGSGSLSPVVPELSGTGFLKLPVNDWRYTWMFTGQQSDVTDGTVFDGDVVIWENRPFAIDNGVPAGEPVVEAVFGYSGRVIPVVSGGSLGYGASAKRVVLLRWPDTMPDPDVRVGNWIADVTYERIANVDSTRTRFVDPTLVDTNPGSTTYSPAIAAGFSAFYPYQRCYWYQIAKRTTPSPGPAFDGDSVTYRSMTVWVSTDLKAQTVLDGGATNAASPYHVNAALISPLVVNVFPKTIYTR